MNPALLVMFAWLGAFDSVSSFPFRLAKPMGRTLNSTPHSLTFGARIDARTLSKENITNLLMEGRFPFVLTNVFDINPESWCDDMMSRLGETLIEYDVRHNSDGFMETYESTLKEYISSVEDSSDHEGEELKFLS